MFWVSVLSLISVVLGCLGTCMACCGWLGSCAHCGVNIAYFVLIIFGSLYRFMANGSICSGDNVVYPDGATGNNPNMEIPVGQTVQPWAVKATDKWQYWDKSGDWMYMILIIQYVTIFCMCCCSCCLNCKNKKED